MVSSFQSSDVQFSRMNSKRYVELEHFLMHFSNESYLVDPASGDKLMSERERGERERERERETYVHMFRFA